MPTQTGSPGLKLRAQTTPFQREHPDVGVLSQRDGERTAWGRRWEIPEGRDREGVRPAPPPACSGHLVQFALSTVTVTACPLHPPLSCGYPPHLGPRTWLGQLRTRASLTSDLWPRIMGRPGPPKYPKARRGQDQQAVSVAAPT
ncbi:hypothetical protein SKAU_G00395550 [Synaphobranchus kaupii]|uniref:Uncharacterized protein n=1 Tax=Synaphobranchus kaupii TaxID=118154 RepID=A0A9Q1IE07_SYNKA|nr:hypothetical protein SKAU_G00395550 [Synaphobranchus kaupii]